MLSPTPYNINNKKKQCTSPKYKDLKISWKSNHKWEKFSIETKFVFDWNSNENWLSDNRIYYQFKKILAMVRLQWYVSLNYVKIVINKLFDEHPNFSMGKEKILRHYLDNLLEINIPKKGNKTKYFTTKDRYTALSENELFPKKLWVKEKF